MSKGPDLRSPPTTASGFEPYHDEPTMASAQQQYIESRSPALNTPRAHDDSDPPRPPFLSVRSTVPLIPTPGTRSKRHSTYVCLSLLSFSFSSSDEVFIRSFVRDFLRRNRLYYAFGL
jgi:hypothetical protein